LLDVLVDFLDDALDRLPVEDALANEPIGVGDERIAARLSCAFRRALVKALIVGQRVRVRASTVRVDQGRTAAGAAIRNGLRHGLERLDKVGAVAFGDMQAGEGAEHRGDATARCLSFDRHGYGKRVVFHQNQER
jgi:hypothetical protein